MHKVFDVLKSKLKSMSKYDERSSVGESVVSLLVLLMQGCISHEDLFVSNSLQASTVKLLLETILLGLSRLLNPDKQVADSFGLHIAGKEDSCLTTMSVGRTINCEANFQEVLLKFISVISAAGIEPSKDKSIDSSGIDNYFYDHTPDLNGGPARVADSVDHISPSASHFRVDIIRLLASISKNCLFLLNSSSTSTITVAGIREVRASITAALLSWLSVSEIAVKNDIAKALCILCIQRDVDDDSANLDYWTNLVRQLTHKAGLRGGSSISLDSALIHDKITANESSTNERLLNRDVALACGALKCLQSIAVVVLYNISSRDDQLAQRWKVLRGEAGRLYNQLISFPLFKIFLSPDTPLSPSDISLWVTNGMDCLDVLTSNGCLNLKASAEGTKYMSVLLVTKQ